MINDGPPLRPGERLLALIPVPAAERPPTGDTPDVYAVVEAATPEGVVIQGLYHGRWSENAPTRWLVRKLLPFYLAAIRGG